MPDLTGNFHAVSLDPSLADDGNAADGAADLDANDLAAAASAAQVQFGQQERRARSPPPSLVPRLHVLAHRR